MSYKVDYHMHSNYSDGSMKPTELVRKYFDMEYDIISITDHETIAGVTEAMIAGEALKIKVIPGVEVPVLFEGIDLHILGYNFNTEDEDFARMLEEMQVSRNKRNKKLLSCLKDMGYNIDEDVLKEQSPHGYLGKPNIARALVSCGYISNPKQAFEPGKFFELPEIKKITKERIQGERAIRVINKAGGISVLAHPGKIKGIGDKSGEEYWKRLDELMRSLKKTGLKGLECIYPAHSEEDVLRYVGLAEKYHLHITEGSDFHGNDLK